MDIGIDVQSRGSKLLIVQGKFRHEFRCDGWSIHPNMRGGHLRMQLHTQFSSNHEFPHFRSYKDFSWKWSGVKAELSLSDGRVIKGMLPKLKGHGHTE